MGETACGIAALTWLVTVLVAMTSDSPEKDDPRIDAMRDQIKKEGYHV